MASRRVVVLGALGVAVVAAGLAWGAGMLPFTPGDESASAGTGAGASARPSTGIAPSTAKVERRTLTVKEDLDATLGYAGSMSVAGGLSGTVTWLPAEGTVIKRGGRLYEVDGGPRATLMFGGRPAWRTMQKGMADGADVRQLEGNLKALGYAVKGLKVDNHWDAKTTASVLRWQKAAHLSRDGKVDLGEVVFLPKALRVTSHEVALGSMVGRGAPVLKGTSVNRVVSVSLAADRQDLVSVGAAVDVELPDGSITGGHVSTIGRVAKAGEAGGMPGSTPTPTIDVEITLDDPAAGAALDQAPVTVHVVTTSHENVLTVPVRALVALIEGGYAVEVLAPDGSRRYVGVKTGLFQDGYVEIEATGLAVGDTVVVAA